MNGLTGMEKFSHLEDKIYLTIEYAKKMRDEKERLERESNDLKTKTAEAIEDKRRAEEKLAIMLSERDSMQSKVEAMLDAMALLDSDLTRSVGR